MENVKRQCPQAMVFAERFFWHQAMAKFSNHAGFSRRYRM
jgi:hypothetical protein